MTAANEKTVTVGDCEYMLPEGMSVSEFTVLCKTVERTLKTTQRKIVRMMLNGTLPIGAVAEPQDINEKYVIRIIPIRWEKWLRGEL